MKRNLESMTDFELRVSRLAIWQAREGVKRGSECLSDLINVLNSGGFHLEAKKTNKVWRKVHEAWTAVEELLEQIKKPSAVKK